MATFAVPLVAGLDAASVEEITRALSERRAIGLIHDRLPPDEQSALAARLAASPVPDDTAVVVFTSGSTGRPKGVVISRGALDAAIAASAAHLGSRPDDRWLLALPPAHISGFGVIARNLALGVPPVIAAATAAPFVLSERSESKDAFLVRPSPSPLSPLPSPSPSPPATLVSMVPTQLARILDDATWTPPPSWRAVLLGGAASSADLVDRARARGVPVLTTYGMSETCGQIATCPPDRRPPTGAVGVPLPGISITAGTRAAPEIITVRTPAAFSSYLDEPRPSPDSVITTDLGFVEDGWLHVVGRADDVIITGGEKVHPLPIEHALTTIPGISAACVVGIPDPTWGQLVAAAIVATPTASLRAHLDTAISALAPHARPRRIEFVDELPLGATGKVDRAAIAVTLAMGASSATRHRA